MSCGNLLILISDINTLVEENCRYKQKNDQPNFELKLLFKTDRSLQITELSTGND